MFAVGTTTLHLVKPEITSISKVDRVIGHESHREDTRAYIIQFSLNSTTKDLL